MTEECMVKPINEEISGCLVETPGCDFAVVFGFSFHCLHPEHRRMAMDALTKHRGGDLLQRYCELRERRRRAFASQLGMPLEEYLEAILSEVRPEESAGGPGASTTG